MTPLTLRLFGSFDLQVEERPVSGCSRPVQALLMLLALRHDRSVDRSWLAQTLWPDAAPDRARFYLRRYLNNLRKALGAERHRLLSPTPATLRLDLSGAECDLLAFDVLIARQDSSALEEALRLYRGPLLESCDEPWILQERETRAASVLRALESLAEDRAQRGDLGEAARLLHRAITMDPLHETGYCRLMEVLAASGDLAGVEQQYRELRLLLRNEMNTEPSSATTALYRRLCAQSRTPQPILSASPNTSPTRRMPCPLTALIGRARERQEILQAKSRARLLTLTGIGGVGKTRLAIAVAEEMEPAYPDGVWFVDLSSLQEPALLAQTIAQALGVRASPGLPFEEALLPSLRQRRLLLVMDNCEHLIQGCALWIKRILQECPEAHVLCTSRQPLRIAGERIWPVDPLPVPPSDSPGCDKDELPGELRHYDSVVLLLDRAATVAPLFRLTPRNAGAVVQICRTLDGIPLAIELAAARLRNMSAQEIAARLEDRFHMLTTGDRTLPRHQTLQAAMDWSYDLLNDPERTCLQRLSVFAGGCTLEAADAITREALDPLASLVDKSLVVYEEKVNGESHYRLLETVRQYAWERLGECGARNAVRLRHRDYFLSLAEAAEPHLNGPEQGIWLERLESEHDNLRVALDTCLQEEEAEDGSAESHSVLPNPQAGLRLAGSLQRFWFIRGYLSEGRAHLKAALERDRATEQTKERAKALYGEGVLAWRQSDYPAARARYEQSLVMYRASGDRQGVANALNNLGTLESNQGDNASARVLYEESLAIQRALGTKQGIFSALTNLGNLAWYGADYAEAKALYEECLTLKRELGDRLGVASSLDRLGMVACARGEYREAKALYEECLTIRTELEDRPGISESLNELAVVAQEQGDYRQAAALHQRSLTIKRELGDRTGIARSLINLGSLTADQEDYAAARTLYEESLEITRELGVKQLIGITLMNLGVLACKENHAVRAGAYLAECLDIQKEIGDKRIIACALEGCALLAWHQSRMENAARFWGAGAALRERIGCPLSPNERMAQQREVTAVQQALGEEGFTAAYQAGRALTLEQAIEFALANRI